MRWFLCVTEQRLISQINNTDTAGCKLVFGRRRNTVRLNGSGRSLGIFLSPLHFIHSGAACVAPESPGGSRREGCWAAATWDEFFYSFAALIYGSDQNLQLTYVGLIIRLIFHMLCFVDKPE